MSNNLSKNTLGLTQLQSGQGNPLHQAPLGSFYIDVLTAEYYKNTDGINNWVTLATGGAVSGEYLPLSGGTVTGATIFTNGLTANTISATSLTTDYIDFTKLPLTAYTHLEGRVHWNDNLKTLEIDTENSNVRLDVGHELVMRVNNQTGSPLLKGRAVYIDGQQGQRPTVTYATYTADTTSAGVVGLVLDDINNNNNGYVISYGIIENVDTSAYSAGTPLYLFTGGTLTDVKPQAPLHDVRIGKVINSSVTGSIAVVIQNGYEIDELHDVRINDKVFGDLISLSAYNGSDVWVNTKTLNGSYTITGNTTIGGQVRAASVSATTFSAITSNLPISNTQVIYSNNGVLTGSTAMTWSNSATTLTINGTLEATSKSFSIAHPTKEGKKLIYGSLEGPENGVYHRGKLYNEDTIILPEYWSKLVDKDTVTIHLTSIGKYQNLYVKEVLDDKVIIGIDSSIFSNKTINCYYVVYGERKDINKLEVER